MQDGIRRQRGFVVERSESAIRLLEGCRLNELPFVVITSAKPRKSLKTTLDSFVVM
jgi:hypothetical protein